MYPQAGRWAYIHRWHLLPSTGSAIHVGTRGVWLSSQLGCVYGESWVLPMLFAGMITIRLVPYVPYGKQGSLCLPRGLGVTFTEDLFTRWIGL